MATENLDCIYSLPAGADLRTKQGFPVVINTSGQIVLAGAGAVAHGHLHNLPDVNEMARFVHNGKVVKGVVGTGGVTLGARCSAAATGYVISATSTHAYIAIALKVGAAGDVIEFLILPGLGAVA